MPMSGVHGKTKGSKEPFPTRDSFQNRAHRAAKLVGSTSSPQARHNRTHLSTLDFKAESVSSNTYITRFDGS
jgi:hypothetical protein